MDGQMGSDELKKELHRKAIKKVGEFIGSLPEGSLIRTILVEQINGKPSIVDREAMENRVNVWR